MKAYKGFDKLLRCRGFQYEIGGTYETEKADICEFGFHACEYPLDVFRYYVPADSRYCEVDLDANDQKDIDSKRVGKQIRICNEIGLCGLTDAAVCFTRERTHPTKVSVSDGDRSATMSTSGHSSTTSNGDHSAATSTGDHSATTSDGYHSATTNTGDHSAATSDGESSSATSTGIFSAVKSIGSFSAATNTGDYSAALSRGVYSASVSTGLKSAATSNGSDSVALTIGKESAAASNGSCSIALATGMESAAASNGSCSIALSSGAYSEASAGWKDSIAIVTGFESKAKGDIGCWLVLTERSESFRILGVKAVHVDGETIKKNTFYMLLDGEVVEVVG